MRIGTVSLVALIVVLAGCSVTSNYVGGVDPWMVEASNDQAVRNAIIRQSTLYPYQFVENSENLNWLGARDLAALIGHFKAYPGRLSIRQGYVSDDLYKRRVQKVMDVLRHAGIDVSRVKVKDLPAGGDGMSSERVIVIRRQDESTGGVGQTGKTSISGVQQ